MMLLRAPSQPGSGLGPLSILLALASLAHHATASIAALNMTEAIDNIRAANLTVELDTVLLALSHGDSRSLVQNAKVSATARPMWPLA